jgi:hypothetical protein
MLLPILVTCGVLGIVAFLIAQTGRGNYNEGACQLCRRPAQVNEVALRYNIGMLVARRYATTKGWLCKPCIHRLYWKYAAINLTVGWLGYISLFCAPIFLLMNTWVYLRSMGLASPGAAPMTGFNPSPPPMG